MTRFIICASLLLAQLAAAGQSAPDTVQVEWDKAAVVSRTTATLQLVENPMVRPGSPIHKGTFQALQNLGADYIRYVPWFPYPKMAVAELKPPAGGKTFWDFTWCDSTMEALMQATKGHSTCINFSTTPAWMWKTDAPVPYPDDAYQVSWTYNQGTQLRDTTCREVAGYFARLFSWYTKGGFTDELGQYHKSGHYYNIPYWEVLNEPDLEHNISPQLYTRMYDAIVTELKKISPQTKFVGLSLAYLRKPEYFEYFLNHANHRPGVPLDGISYHHYSSPSFSSQDLEDYQYTFFEKAEGFIDKVRYIESIRKRLSPNTFTMINEIGVILRPPSESAPIPHEYWNLAGSMFAYIYLELAKLGIEVAGESQLVGYPTQYPDVSMMNWETGRPNARYWVLKLIRDNFGPGDRLAGTGSKGVNGAATPVVAQAFLTRAGKKILLLNRQNKAVTVSLPPDVRNSQVSFVDPETGENALGEATTNGNLLQLKPFSVAVVTVK